MKRFLLITILVACAHKPKTTNEDTFLWLEEIEAPKSLAWVQEQNTKSDKALSVSEQFQRLQKDTLAILEAKDKIPSGMMMKNSIINFWRDEVHVRGLLRSATLQEFQKKNPRWVSILDIDVLSKKEKENWVYKGINCLEPDYIKCMVTLSRGGKDASVEREFDMKRRQFVDKGFVVQEAKTDVTWVDKDTLLVATDFGPGSLTDSGYPRFVKLWKRGTPLEKAKTVFEVNTKDVRAGAIRNVHRDSVQIVLQKAIDFFNTEESVLDIKTLKSQPIPKPQGAEMMGYFEGQFIYKVQHPWSFAGKDYIPGALMAISQTAAGKELQANQVQLIFSPKENQSVQQILALKNKFVFSILEDVKSKVFVTEKNKDGWQEATLLRLNDGGAVNLSASTDEKDFFMYLYENFNQPSALWSYDFKGSPQKLKSLPDRFDASDLQIDQNFATSKDGTKVPYFLVYKKGTRFDGTAPTLQYGYGGFMVSQGPQYNPIVGKLWLEKGGVYVVANIRGGGEYGPRWHQAVLKQNRQKAYDDFIAVSEDLIQRKITSPARLAIRGGSNGGLLVGAVMTQRPDLYGAVLCWVPLLDMMRYSQLLAGASWMGEYGDPTDVEMKKVILKYSPYQNVFADRKYPPVLFVTSTKDDRVHPGHARKMAAKMIEQKHFVMYYENTEGGHGASANFKQMAKLTALQYEFLLQTIGTSLNRH